MLIISGLIYPKAGQSLQILIEIMSKRAKISKN